MRAPTPLAPLYAWHAAAIANERPQITSEPQLGWFKRRIVKGGPFVPARIWMEQPVDPESGELVGPEELHCEVGGKPMDPVDQWLWLANNPISEAEFHYLAADANWLKSHAPRAPEANPESPISPSDIPALF